MRKMAAGLGFVGVLGLSLAAMHEEALAAGLCGQPVSDWYSPVASDALAGLRSAIGLRSACDNEPCLCDVDSSDSVTTADALAILKASAGQLLLECDCRTRVFFSVNGRGGCDSLTVDVDNESGAVFARNFFGLAVCTLHPDLVALGCGVAPNEFSERMAILVHGCRIPATGPLFSCQFESVNLVALQAATDSMCSCSQFGRCDSSPPICDSLSVDPGSCEDCINGEDDDGNGLADCDDANCRHHPACPTTTTTTSSSTTLTSTTLLPLRR